MVPPPARPRRPLHAHRAAAVRGLLLRCPRRPAELARVLPLGRGGGAHPRGRAAAPAPPRGPAKKPRAATKGSRAAEAALPRGRGAATRAGGGVTRGQSSSPAGRRRTPAQTGGAAKREGTDGGGDGSARPGAAELPCAGALARWRRRSISWSSQLPSGAPDRRFRPSGSQCWGRQQGYKGALLRPLFSCFYYLHQGVFAELSIY